MAEIVPRSTFNLRPGESHLGGFAIATEAVEAVLGEWTSPSAARRRSGSRERSPASEPRPVGRSNRPR